MKKWIFWKFNNNYPKSISFPSIYKVLLKKLPKISLNNNFGKKKKIPSFDEKWGEQFFSCWFHEFWPNY